MGDAVGCRASPTQPRQPWIQGLSQSPSHSVSAVAAGGGWRVVGRESLCQATDARLLFAGCGASCCHQPNLQRALAQLGGCLHRVQPLQEIVESQSQSGLG